MAADTSKEFNPYQIHVTSVNNCLGKFWYGLIGEKPLVDARCSLRGSMAHGYAYQRLTKSKKGYIGLVESRRIHQIDHSIYKDLVETEMPTIMNNIDDWIENTKIPKDNQIVEKEYSTELRDGFSLVGVPDWHTLSDIVDFKSGGDSIRKEYAYQLSAYRGSLLGNTLVDKDANCYLVFVGDKDGYQEKKIPEETLTKAYGEFKVNLEKEIDRRIKVMEDFGCSREEFKPSFTCCFCNYRHLCNIV